ncbi:hypothetical protein [Acanthopleuribacter pedis]|uniref:Uncharacterized protein n=1 Tax=Acanthopleuribacter pedis TaxID=442870 RepID=A0A8J7U501_9BACT|nr:hypothetical protein [Acanthopleuribacter pedis]MBO1318816.1 hypothetical protein [Acanthopleuribacter pedis]
MTAGLLLLCCLWLSPGESALIPRGDRVFFQEADDLVVLNPAAEPIRQVLAQTQLITAVGDGLIIRDKDGFQFYLIVDGSRTPLPDPPAPPLMIELPWVKGPAFLSRDALHVLHQNRWQRLAVPIWYDFTAAVPATGALQGLVGRFPLITNGNGGSWLVYQPKSGETLVWRPSTGKVRRAQTKDDLRLVTIGNQTLWLGAPNDQWVSQVNWADPDRFGEKTRVPGLNRYSPLLAAADGVWLIGFSDGWRDMMAAWKSGRTDVTLNFLQENYGQPSNQTIKLSEMPLHLKLSTSNSGSPRTKVQPSFSVVPVLKNGEVAVVDSEQLAIYRAGRATPILRTRRGECALPALIFYRADRYIAVDRTGQTTPLEASP